MLQAATLGEQGATYVLDMGEQIKVLDLAQKSDSVVRLCAGREIPIRFVGLRPGEKLYEELVGTDEIAERVGPGQDHADSAYGHDRCEQGIGNDDGDGSGSVFEQFRKGD